MQRNERDGTHVNCICIGHKYRRCMWYSALNVTGRVDMQHSMSYIPTPIHSPMQQLRLFVVYSIPVGLILTAQVPAIDSSEQHHCCFACGVTWSTDTNRTGPFTACQKYKHMEHDGALRHVPLNRQHRARYETHHVMARKPRMIKKANTMLVYSFPMQLTAALLAGTGTCIALHT